MILKVPSFSKFWRHLCGSGRAAGGTPSITSLLLQISTLWEKKTIQPEERWFSQYFITKQKGEPLKTLTLSSLSPELRPGVWGMICLIYLGDCEPGPSIIITRGRCHSDDPGDLIVTRYSYQTSLSESEWSIIRVFDKAPIFRWLISIPSMSMFQASEFSFNLVKRSKPRSGCIEFKIVKLRTRMNDKFSQLLLSWAPFNRTQGLASIQQTNKHRGRLLSQKAHSNSCCASQKWSIQIKQIGRSQKDLEVLGPPTKFTQRRSVILWICNVFGS